VSQETAAIEFRGHGRGQWDEAERGRLLSDFGNIGIISVSSARAFALTELGYLIGRPALADKADFANRVRN
jgi:hypothetical protein